MAGRRIVVNSTEFHWTADIRAVDSQRIIRLRAWQIRAGRTLIADLVGKDNVAVDTAYPTPKDARLLIEYGLTHGWKADERGANMLLSSADAIEFGNLRLIDAPTESKR